MKTALFVIDCQEKLFPKMVEADRLQKKITSLITGLQALGIPILSFEQYPKGLGATLHDLKILLSDVPCIEKISFSCLGVAESKKWLIKNDIRQVILCGIETHVCIFQTAEDLRKEGLDVTLVADATSSRVELDKTWALQSLQQMGCEITTLERLLFSLLKSSSHPLFKTLQRNIIACN